MRFISSLTEHISQRAVDARRQLRRFVIDLARNVADRDYFDREKSYLAAHPESHVRFNAHPEFHRLFPRFTHQNLANGLDIARLWSFILNVKHVMNEKVEGDVAELGVWRGNTAAILAEFARQSGRRLFLFDTFTGFAELDLAGVDRGRPVEFGDTSLAMVRDVIGGGDECEFVKGWFPGSVTAEHESCTFAVVSLDCDLYAPMSAGLDFFYPRMASGALCLLHDYSSGHWDGAKRAVDEFSMRTGERVVLLPDRSGSALFRKAG